MLKPWCAGTVSPCWSILKKEGKWLVAAMHFFNADGRCDTRNDGVGIASHGPSVMNDEISNGTIGTEEGRELLDRRLFLQSMGKWSAAAIAAAVGVGTWLALSP